MPKPPRDILVLFSTRVVRLLAYGSLSVFLVLYLSALGLTEPEIGLLLTLTLAGDTVVSLWLTTRADRFGRRRTLLVGAFLMIGAGVVFALSDSFTVLLIAATIGVISPSGNEVGPFLSIEQAALSQVVSDRNRTTVFAWYTMAGALATAVGSLAGGLLIEALDFAHVKRLTSYRIEVAGYALLGVALLVVFTRLSPAAEAPGTNGTVPFSLTRKLGQSRTSASKDKGLLAGLLGLGKSKKVILRLSTLFAMDAFGGGFVIQSLTAYWFYKRFDVEPAALGGIFFGANVLAGLSALAAARIAKRFGLINTMVFTHLPSNILLILVPLMPNLSLAIAVLFLRFSISQMDVPTRQSYVMAVTPPEERSAAAGVTGVARTIGAAISPFIAGHLLASPATLDVIFYIAGGMKIIYDLMLYRGFVKDRPPEEGGISPGKDIRGS